MQADEAGTLATLKRRRAEILQPLVARHHGRIVKVMGDGVLIEFASAVNAAQCAIELQQGMAATNSGQPEDRHIVLRIGVNLGDVIVEGGDLYGDGVNIAARLESLADPGGVLVSGTAFDHIKSKIKVDFEDLGTLTLKNIVEPVRAYRVVGTPTVAVTASESVSEKPSVAVLPFINMSGDAQQDHIADGITENIITGLCRFRDLLVIARNSTSVYKGRAAKIQDISRALGARYILEGSMQRGSDKIRITAQLVDGATGQDLWAERYDRKVDDIFAALDEVTDTIIGTLATGYGGRLRKTLHVQGRRNLRAFDCFVRGLEHAERFNREDNLQSRAYFEKAIELDPHYGKALAKLAWSYMLDMVYGWGGDPVECWPLALKLATRAIEVDDDESWGHWALAGYWRFQGQYERAVREYFKAVELNPNDADVLADFGYCLSFAGQARDGLECIRKAMRLNPHYPDWYTSGLVLACFESRMYQEAIETLGSLRSIDTVPTSLYLAASHAALGHSAGAGSAIKRALELDPRATVTAWATPEHFPYKNVDNLEHFRDCLRRAGLPE
jgi:adenylate cyclase